MSRWVLACVGVVAALLVSPGAWGAKGVDGVVNLNTAPVEILGLLPGVGPAKAAQIVAYRRRRPFRTVDELVRIRGIGRKMVRGLRTHLAVAGPTTATAAPASSSPAAPPPPPPAPPRPPVPAAARFVHSRPIAPLRSRAPPSRERWPSHGVCPKPR